MPHNGGVRQSRPPACEFAAVVGQAVAHVVQQQIAVGTDHLIGQLRFGGVGGGGECRCVAPLATGLEEQVLARQHFWRV